MTVSPDSSRSLSPLAAWIRGGLLRPGCGGSSTLQTRLIDDLDVGLGLRREFDP